MSSTRTLRIFEVSSFREETEKIFPQMVPYISTRWKIKPVGSNGWSVIQ